MRVSGRVSAMDRERGRVAFQTSQDRHTVVDIVGDERPHPDDMLEWSDARPEQLLNLTRDEAYAVRRPEHGLRGSEMERALAAASRREG